MFHNAGDQYILAVRYGIDFNLDTHQVLIYKYRIILLVAEDYLHILMYVFIGERYYHVLTAQNIAGTQQNRVIQLMCNGNGLFFGHYARTLGSLDLQLLKQLIKALAILGAVDCIGAGTQYAHTLTFQELSQLNGSSTAESNDNAIWIFCIYDTHYILGRKRLKVQSVGCIKVGGHSFRVIVYDNRLKSGAFECPYTVNGSIVELYALTYANRSTTQDYYGLLIGRMRANEVAGLVYAIISGVEVRGLCGKFGSAGINHCKARGSLLLQLLTGQLLYRTIEEAQLLGAHVQFVINRTLTELALHCDKAHELAQEPLIDHSDFVYHIGRYAAAQCFVYAEYALIGALMQLLNDFVIAERCEILHTQRVLRYFGTTHGLHERLFKAGTQCHNLAGCLHLSAQSSLCVYELIKRPLGELNGNVVQCRLEQGACLMGYRIAQLVHSIADGYLGGNLGYRVTGRLGRQSRRTADARVNLYYGVFKRIRLECELNVATAFYTQRMNNIECRSAQHLVFLIRQSHAGRDNYTVTGMHSNGIEVLHRADRDCVTLGIAHDLELDFLPAGYALFDKHLRNR